MKAILFKEPGGPEKLYYGEHPGPVPGPDDVIIRVKACALNHLDLWVLQGIPAYKVQLPHILGADVSGEVYAVGARAKGLRKGQRVFVGPGISCGHCEWCLSGRDNQCDSFCILGAKFPGGYAQFVKVPATNVFPIPGKLNFEQASAFPLTFLTAWHMLVGRARLQAGESVLILGAASGVGVAAVQIAKSAKCRVLAAAGSDEKCAKLRQLGADWVMNYKKEDIVQAARKFTGGRGVDVVLEHIGPDTWNKSIESLAKCGRLVTCGATSGPQVTMDVRYLFMKDLTVLGSKMGTRQELKAVCEVIARGKIRPVIDSVFPLARARQALEKMVSRNVFGKIILKPE